MALAAAAAALGGETGGGPPLDWDVADGKNVRWVAELGTTSYGGPVVAGGRVYVGTNNARPRDPGTTGDRGVLMAFSAGDGTFLWQATHQKLAQDLDFPLQGVCSTPVVAADRVYYVSNRGELLCLDAEGFRDGENDGPYEAEEATGDEDADVIWRLDMPARLGVVPHYMSASTPALDGDLLFVVTSNGVDVEGGVPAPHAPSFLAVDRWTGEVRWSDAAPGRGLVDGQWSSPTVARLAGRKQVLFPGGDGWLYSLAPASGELLWRFDGNAPPDRPRPEGRERNAFVATAVVAGERIVVPVGRDPEEGSAPGSLWCLEGSSEGGGSGAAVLWHYGGEDFGRAIATPTVAGGVVYAADLDGFVVALELETGKPLWRYDALAPVWAAPLVTGDRVYVADTDGEIAILAAGPRLEVLNELAMPAPIYRAPVAAEGVLYLMTSDRLYALEAR